MKRIGEHDTGWKVAGPIRSGRAAILLAAALVFLLGCATYPPQKKDIRSEETFQNGYEEVWDAVAAALSEMNLKITSMEKDAGKIMAEDPILELRQYELGRYDAAYCFCGSPHRYNVFRQLVGIYAVSLDKVSDSRTTVKIDATYQASMFSGDSFTGWLPCPSKGVFEPFFLQQIPSHLREKKKPRTGFEWWKPRRGY